MVMEDGLIEVFQFLGQVIGIAVLRIEMDTSVAILFEDGTQIFLPDLRRQQDAVGRHVVEFQECLALAVRVQHIRPLVFPVQIRCPHSIQQIRRFLTGEDARSKYSHLSLQHLIEMGNLHTLTGLRKADKVVRLIQAVLPLVGADRSIYALQRICQECLYLFSRHGLPVAAYSAIHPCAVLFARKTCCIYIPAAGFTRLQGLMNSRQKIRSLCTYRNIRGNKGLQESDIAAHIIERHHRSAVTYQRIIRIVPFRTQRIHPYARIRNKIRQFGQQRNKQLVRHGGPAHLLLLVQNQFGICAHLRH